MSEFMIFLRLLRRDGFQKRSESRAGGIEVREYRRNEADGRTLVCQIWADGKHRMSHEWIGCSDTTPTDFFDQLSYDAALLREALRTDSKYRNPKAHHVPWARELLTKRRELAS